MKDVQCYELFGGIAPKNHAFSFNLDFNIQVCDHMTFNYIHELICFMATAVTLWLFKPSLI